MWNKRIWALHNYAPIESREAIARRNYDNMRAYYGKFGTRSPFQAEMDDDSYEHYLAQANKPPLLGTDRCTLCGDKDPMRFDATKHVHIIEE